MLRRGRQRAASANAPARADFDAVARRIEEGKATLVGAVPSPRGVPVRPLAEALLGFEEAIREARAELERRASPETAAWWERCRAALEEGARRAERLRLEAPHLDYESLVTVLGDLIAPLEAFEEGERSVQP